MHTGSCFWDWRGVLSRLSEYAGWYFRVYVLVHLSRMESSAWRNLTAGEKLLVGESGTVGPMLTSAASAPRRPSHAGVGNTPHSVLPNTAEFGNHGAYQTTEECKPWAGGENKTGPTPTTQSPGQYPPHPLNQCALLSFRHALTPSSYHKQRALPHVKKKNPTSQKFLHAHRVRISWRSNAHCLTKKKNGSPQ